MVWFWLTTMPVIYTIAAVVGAVVTPVLAGSVNHQGALSLLAWASSIGDRLSLTEQRVRRIATRERIALQPCGTTRRLGVHLSARRDTIVKGLADIAGVTPAAMLSRLAATVIDEGIQTAIRRLGRGAIPKRPYQRREIG